MCYRSSSAQVSDPMNPRHHPSRPADGHRPTQSMLPAYHQTPCTQQHIPSPSQQDQSLQQLVQSRTAQGPMESPSFPGGSPQLLHPHLEGMQKPGRHQQPVSPKLTTRQSGNPFAHDYPVGGGNPGMGQPGSRPLRRGVSGNPFAATWEMKLESSKQDHAGCGHHPAGNLGVVDSNVHGVRCDGSGREDITAAGGTVQQCAQPQAPPSCVGMSANSASSAHLQKNPEMSPLQNGLIRCAASAYSCVHIFQAFLLTWPNMPVLLHTVSWLSCMVFGTQQVDNDLLSLLVHTVSYCLATQ